MSILGDTAVKLKRHIETEIQEGRRYVALDSDVVSAFLAMPDRLEACVAKTAPTSAPSPSVIDHPVVSVPVQTKNAPKLDSLDKIATAVAACKACGLCQGRKQTVPGIGNAHSPEIMFIGEGPGAEEDAHGEPFVGAAGQLLTKMIQAMGYERSDVFIANVVKCRPPENRTPASDEMAACMPWLRNQIDLIKPKCIVALGATALRGLIATPQASITKMRGVWHKFDAIPLMPTFHPSYLLRYPPAKKNAWDDLKTVLTFLGKTPPPPPPKRSVNS